MQRKYEHFDLEQHPFIIKNLYWEQLWELGGERKKKKTCSPGPPSFYGHVYFCIYQNYLKENYNSNPGLAQ